MSKPIKRQDSKGKARWMARVFDHNLGRKVSVGTFDTKKEAQEAINDFYARPRPGRMETCDSFATRWTRDYPRPRESTNKHNRERVQRFAKDFKGVRMSDVNRPIRKHRPAYNGTYNAGFRQRPATSPQPDFDELCPPVGYAISKEE